MKILIAHPYRDLAELVGIGLKENNHTVKIVSNLDLAIAEMRASRDLDLILAPFRSLSGVKLLEEKAKSSHPAKIWIMSGVMDDHLCDEVIALGAEKGVPLDKIYNEMRAAGLTK